MIAELALPYTNVRLYQDALPLCEKEADIVKEIAARGSKNHQFLVELMEQGARLVGTEDPHLLLQEYQFLQGALGGGSRTGPRTGGRTNAEGCSPSGIGSSPGGSTPRSRLVRSGCCSWARPIRWSRFWMRTFW